MFRSQVANQNGRTNTTSFLLRISLLSTAAFFCSPFVEAQNSLTTPAPGCPVEIVSLKPSGVSMHVRNTSGKKIVGLVFNAALADATEHWKWYHWEFASRLATSH